VSVAASWASNSHFFYDFDHPRSAVFTPLAIPKAALQARLSINKQEP
jgi:hypothetical protein